MLENFSKALYVFVFTLFFHCVASAIPAEGGKIMISAPSAHAVEAGKKVYKKGGNVIDVAVAIGLTLTVTNPYNASMGGGGFALVKMGKTVDVLDFRETAPAATSPDFYVKRKKGDSITGGAAIGIPGVPAGLWALHEKYGKLSWRKLFDVALDLAGDGMQVTGYWSRKTEGQKKRFSEGGFTHFFKSKDEIYKPGDVLKQRALAKALRKFRTKGPRGFYQGDVAKDIVKSVKKTGGVITLEDLANYKVRWLKPLETEFQGHKVYLMPPPSSGGVVIKAALELFEKVKIDKKAPLSVDELHLMAEVLNRAFRSRALLGDPDYHQNPYEQILSESYINKMAKSIKVSRAVQLKPLKEQSPPKESNETEHFSVLDSEGNSISLTVTLNGGYGSGVVTNRYGIALNNEMDDFTTRPGEPNMFGLVQGLGNRVEPGKRPLSSMSPTLIEKDGKVVMSLGAPGGPRIISSVIQTIYRVLVTELDLDRAVQFPRVHHQFLPNKLFVDEFKFSPEVVKGLKRKGHKVETQRPLFMGRVKAVRKNKKGYLEAAFDNRSEGAVGGY